MENLSIYNKLSITPPEARKEIAAGRLKGFTDINPMWRIKCLTENFGACGFGWKYVITSKRLEQGCKGQVSAFVDIDLFVKINDVWSEAIQGTGGSSFITEEKNGLYQSDECYKMALTDAISVACKALGMSADIYYQKDRSKYTVPENPQPAPPKAPTPTKLPTLIVATKEYNGCVSAMSILNDKTGKNYSIDDFKMKYEITEDVAKLLIEDHHFQTNPVGLSDPQIV